MEMRLRFCSLLSSLLCALSLSAAEAEVGTGASFKGPVGLQLYSLRGEFIRNVPTTLEKVHSFGIHNVELAGTYNLPPDKFTQLLEANHLTAISGHFPFERFRDNPETIAK